MSSITAPVSSTSTSATPTQSSNTPLPTPPIVLTSPGAGPYDTCTPLTITWTYSGPNQLLFIEIFSSLSPSDPITLTTVNVAASNWTWPSINVPPAEYNMEAWLLSTDIGYSTFFAVVDGGNTSCVADIATPSAVPTTSSATTDVGAIVGGVLGAVVGVILLVLLFFLCRRRRRNAGASRATRGVAEFQLAPMNSQTAHGRTIEAPYPVDMKHQDDFIPDYIPASGDEKGGYHGFGEPLPAYALPPSSLHVPGSALVNDHRKQAPNYLPTQTANLGRSPSYTSQAVS